ncbi:hypothetical protein BX600DRAFT_451043 [Xylariales sp. PMI_506]|nr:hypothetical protein BX600DRAFT_451043 [Xylariales sp. PMI_506]
MTSSSPAKTCAPNRANYKTVLHCRSSRVAMLSSHEAAGPPPGFAKPCFRYQTTHSSIILDPWLEPLDSEGASSSDEVVPGIAAASMGQTLSGRPLQRKGWAYAPPDPSIMSGVNIRASSPTVSSTAPDRDLEQVIFGQRYQKSSTDGEVVRTRQRYPQNLFEFMPDCIVCAESKPLDEFPRFSVSTRCSHPPNTCLDCVQTSIKTEFATKRWDQIHCPECNELMEYQDVERYADKETFVKYAKP